MDSGCVDAERDALRDALAILAAGMRTDGEGVGAVLSGADMFAVTGQLCMLLVSVLMDHGADPVEWVAAQQARARGDLSE